MWIQPDLSAQAAFLSPITISASLGPSTFTSRRTHRVVPCRSVRRHAARMAQASGSEMDPTTVAESTIITKEMISTATAAADAAGEIIRRYFRRSPSELGLSHKSDQSPVTVVDREVEAAVRAIISEAFPGHEILGEEEGTSNTTGSENESLYVWVIDPIDGTKAFVSGRATFGTLISLCYKGAPKLGLIDQPIMRERWLGVEGLPTTLNGVPVQVAFSEGQELRQCVVQATTPEMFVGLDGIAFRNLRLATKDVVYGSDCYAYAMLASGCADLIVEADLKLWDFMALVPVVQCAGGSMSDWRGCALGMWSDGRVVAAASQAVLSEVVAVLEAVESETQEEEFSPKPSRISEPLATPPTRPAITYGNGNGLPEDPGEGHVESMTGFGVGVARGANAVVNVEIRSVNSRYCDVQVRGPKYLMQFDSEIVALVKREAARGKLIVGLDISIGEKDTLADNKQLPVVVDKTAAKAVRKLLDDLAEAAGVPADTSLSNILTFSEVFVKRDLVYMAEEVLAVAKKAVSLALASLRASRRKEGALLEHDLMKRTKRIRELLEGIEERAPGRVKKERERLEQLTNDITRGVKVDGMRMEYEVTVFADRVDISEEIVRLQSHLTIFDMTFLGAHEPIGQRLNFLLQEMHREATTIGAKAIDAPIAHLAVLMKEEIEKIREQCQNIR